MPQEESASPKPSGYGDRETAVLETSARQTKGQKWATKAPLLWGLGELSSLFPPPQVPILADWLGAQLPEWFALSWATAQIPAQTISTVWSLPHMFFSMLPMQTTLALSASEMEADFHLVEVQATYMGTSPKQQQCCKTHTWGRQKFQLAAVAELHSLLHQLNKTRTEKNLCWWYFFFLSLQTPRVLSITWACVGWIIHVTASLILHSEKAIPLLSFYAQNYILFFQAL